MIKKLTDFNDLSGVLSPLLPLIYVDFEFKNTETDGAYVQTDEKNEIVAVFSLKNGCATLIKLGGIIDVEELEGFFSFLSVDSCLSDSSIFSDKEKMLPLLQKNIRQKARSDSFVLDEHSRLSQYKDVYDLLNENGDNFLEWFTVTGKKVSNKKALAIYKCEDKIPVSVAFATAIYKGKAIISGVSTVENYRKRGYASKCVRELSDELGGRGISSVYLWCEEHNLPFYEKIGFFDIGNVFIREDF